MLVCHQRKDTGITNDLKMTAPFKLIRFQGHGKVHADSPAYLSETLKEAEPSLQLKGAS